VRVVWDIVREIKEGRRSTLQEALSNGFDPNTACQHTGMTALLGACEANDLEAVQLLLDAGADPNQLHFDGYDSYHSTSSRAVREVLLQRGFSRLIDGPTTGRGLHSRRVFAPREITNQWTAAMDGPTVIVEYCRSTFPPSSGDVIVRIGLDVRFVVPGDHVTFPSAAGPIEAVVDLVSFVGEFQLRLWDERTIAGNPGARTFWLPPWTAL
jgi:hypothetical protein